MRDFDDDEPTRPGDEPRVRHEVRPAREAVRVTVPKHVACCDGDEGSACDVETWRDGDVAVTP